MIYDFNVGDKVYARDGAWGTLIKDAYGDWAWVCCHSSKLFNIGMIYGVMDAKMKPYSYFISIGDYDFTESQKIAIDYWKSEFEWMKNDRDRYLKLLNKVLKEIPHTCDNCNGRKCTNEIMGSGGCNWEWNGWNK